MTNNTKTLRQAAVQLLQELGPQHYQLLTDEILSRGLATSSSKTPAASLGRSHLRSTTRFPNRVGGDNTINNAQNTCRTCNRRKGARTTEEFVK